MKHIGNELNTILSARRIKKKVFAGKLGMTDVNLSKILKKESIDAGLLERISSLLRMPINFWFDENLSPDILFSDVAPSDISSEMGFLRQMIQEKERTIQILMNKGVDRINTQVAEE